MFVQTFKNIDNILWKDEGLSSELDYIEQTSWILFLKYLHDLEEEKGKEAKLAGKKYEYIIDEPYRWTTWAAPKNSKGEKDLQNILTGDDLIEFVNLKLFPYLQKFKERAHSSQSIEYKIGIIFEELKNRVRSGYTLRDVIDNIDTLHFQSQKERHELSHLYESKIQNMGNAGRNGGEYYTPRALIRTIIKVVDPTLGKTIYDGAVGSAGFLVEAYEYLIHEYPNRSTKQEEFLQTKTFHGKEKKSLAYIIGIMNMILHGIEAPNIVKTNTLAENIADFQEKDRFDIVLANPPFGANERKEVQQNFPIKTSETAFLFLQHFIKILKAGGKAGIVIKNTFLSNTDNASVSLRKHLLDTCNLHTILDLPGGVFTGAGVKTVVLFFEKGVKTKDIWYYQFEPSQNLGKTNPLTEEHLKEFVNLQKSQGSSENSWKINIKDIDSDTYDLSVRNPNKKNETIIRDPKEIIIEIQKFDSETKVTLEKIEKLIWEQ